MCFPHTRGGVPNTGGQYVRGFSVFPTRVGVYRDDARTHGGGSGFSPHAWGCTVAMAGNGAPGDVFPTRVGVYRMRRTYHRPPSRFPHTRGGVPAELVGDDRGKCVFPTRVGVYRITTWTIKLRWMFSPHAWGCTGDASRAVVENYKFSPHAWGCTVQQRHRRAHPGSFPHTRGGVPDYESEITS